MAFLSDSCTFHELTDDILAACQPFSCGNEDLDDFFAHDATRYAHFLMGKTYCFRLGNDADAIKYLTAITDQRIMEGKDAEYNTWKSGLNHANLLEELEYNWRVEMWGEGYGLQTFRRLGRETITKTKERRRGANHAANAGSTMEPGSAYTFQMPSSESSYNPKITNTTLP